MWHKNLKKFIAHAIIFTELVVLTGISIAILGWAFVAIILIGLVVGGVGWITMWAVEELSKTDSRL